ncbi:hypothetical protein DFJ73DRAFT_871328 [Zopfochytrium polystomum]|nr:hypothetical protein DFJ73DRAFT_871328 [Zopfochytrium polystomum]
MPRFGTDLYALADDPDAEFQRAVAFLRAHASSGDLKDHSSISGPGLPAGISPAATPGHADSVKSTDTLWIPCDSFGGVFTGRSPDQDGNEVAPDPPIHLFMDFNDGEQLAQLPSSSADIIAIDWSTWRYMKPLEPVRGGAGDERATVADEWKRILRPGGLLAFECSVSSILCVPETATPPGLPFVTVGTESVTWEMSNPSHLTVSASGAASRLLANGEGGYSFSPTRVIIPAARPEGQPTPAGTRVRPNAMVRPRANDFKAEYARLGQLYLGVVEELTVILFEKRLSWSSARAVDSSQQQFPLATRGTIDRWFHVCK